MNRLFCNGEPADAALLSAALVNYGHFTSLQVRAGASDDHRIAVEAFVKKEKPRFVGR